MTRLFGVDIAKEISNGFAKAGGLVPGVITRITEGTRTSGNLTGGTNPTTVDHDCQCFLEAGEKRLSGSLSTVQGNFITILGGSINPPAEPTVNDIITMEGGEWTLEKLLERDPAAATYVFRVGK